MYPTKTESQKKEKKRKEEPNYVNHMSEILILHAVKTGHNCRVLHLCDM